MRRTLKEPEIKLERDLKELETSLKRDLKKLENVLRHDMKELEIRPRPELTLHLGGVLAAGIAVIAALVKLL